MNRAPLVSILMSVFNENEAYLNASIESLLAQTFDDFELLIADDYSNADTAALLGAWAKRDRRIFIMRNERNIGLTRSLNLLLKSAKGTYIARMDSDDVAFPNRLQRQVEYLESKPGLALCGSWAAVIEENGKRVGERHPLGGYGRIKSKLVSRNPFIHSSLMLRAESLKEIGGYNEEMRLVQDYDMVLHLASLREVDIIQEELLQYRENAGSLSFSKMRTSLGFALKARKNALLRYGYPAWMALYLVKPALSYVVPVELKKVIYLALRNVRG